MQGATQQGEQGRLAGAVGTDQANAFAGLQRCAGLVKQALGAQLQGQFVEFDH